MFPGWTNESIAYLRDAAKVNDYYRVIAEKIAAHLPDGAHICDAGCGVGELSLALAALGFRVTAVDTSKAAIDSLRKRAPESVTALCGAVEEIPPQEKYDAMVFCLFGSAEQALSIAQEQCAGKVFLIKRDYTHHRFSPGELELGRYSASRAENVLRARGIAFGSENLRLEFGQPFRSLYAAERFFSLYARGQERFRPEEIPAKLEKRDDAEFPYYLPHEKKLRLFTFDLKPRRILICGERGAGKSTLIRRLLAQSQLRVGGFITKREPTADERGFYPIYIHSAAQREEERKYGNENLVGRCDSCSSERFTAAFETLGTAYLREGEVLVMDELGFLENEAEGFRAAVLEALAGERPVIAAVKEKKTPFLDAVRESAGALVVHVTEENRETLFEQLLPLVRSWEK